MMILPDSSEVETLAERVRYEVARARYGQGESSFGITISIGVTCTKGSDQIDEILKNADLALYQAKQIKNTVSVAE